MDKRKRVANRAFWAGALCLVVSVGCGTTRTSNTQRTATEQLLISDAVDRTVQDINFLALSGKSVYFDEQHLRGVVDENYVISSLRQHLLGSGCLLQAKRENAEFIVEPRVGTIGTDSNNLLFGLPATNVPQVAVLAGLPPMIPEIPIAKRRHQRGVAKIAVFAYRRDTGEPAWQSGIVTNESTSNSVWVLGAGPFKRGTIHEGTSFAGKKLDRKDSTKGETSSNAIVHLDQQINFRRGLSRLAPPAFGVQQATAIEATPGAGAPGLGAPVLAPPR